MNEFAARVLAFCKDNGLLDCGGIIVGLSGGPDSVALLKVLKCFKDEGEYAGDICALHVNHNLRPGDCDRDEEFVRRLCGTSDVPLKCVSADVASPEVRRGRTVEEAGRIVRYRAYDEYRMELEKGGRSYAVATAHHGDDLAETFMMNLFRGSGLEGLTGIKAKSGILIRPLLCVTKSEILEFLEGSEYCIDHTNSELDHTRNVWRNRILPDIAEVSVKAPQQAIRDTAALLADDSEFIASEMYKAYEACKVCHKGEVMLNAAMLKGYHRAVVSRVIRHLYLYAAGTLKDFETVNLRDAVEVLYSESSTSKSMPWGFTCFIRNGLFGFAGEGRLDRAMDAVTELMGFVTSDANCEIRVDLEAAQSGITAKLPDSDVQISIRIIENCSEMEYNDKSWFCPIDMISGDITVRNDLGELRFAKAGGTGSKPIKKLLTDLKVPGQSKDKVVGITDDGTVCFIPGAGHSKGFVSEPSRAKCPGTCGKILRIEFK